MKLGVAKVSAGLRLHIHTYVHVYIDICIHICMYVCVNMYIYTYFYYGRKSSIGVYVPLVFVYRLLVFPAGKPPNLGFRDSGI